MAVDELGAVVRVESQQLERQRLGHLVDASADSILALTPHRLALDPARGYSLPRTRYGVHSGERGEVEPFGALAAVGHQVDLDESGPVLVPLGEEPAPYSIRGPDRYRPLQKAAGLVVLNGPLSPLSL